MSHKYGWQLSENATTPESLFMDPTSRRQLLRSALSLSSLAVLSGLTSGCATSRSSHDGPEGDDPSRDLYPVNRNQKFQVDSDFTPSEAANSWNNYFEFSNDKEVARSASRLRVRPWQILIDGLVDKPITIDIDDLLKKMPLEERVYRHRCVEAWSMILPWTGFSMRSLIAWAKPLSRAQYVRFESFSDFWVAPGQRCFWYPWPYNEAMTLAEANNELTFLVTGAYGRPLTRQLGAPLRLAIPWKYGFKSIKALQRITFIEERPKGFWAQAEPSKYGFWANVNPDVPHPEWNQEQEYVLGLDEFRPTELFNGYGPYVAQLYNRIDSENLYK